VEPLKPPGIKPLSLGIGVGAATVRFVASDRILDHVQTKGPFEPQTLHEWARITSEGGIVVDIGAYTGLFSISAALLGSAVIAFEPIPINLERLAANNLLNGIPEGRIDVRPIAVSDRSGPALIGYNDSISFSAGASLERKSGNKIEVELQCLDDALYDPYFRKIRAIKIDVERHELSVLRGAQRTLARYHPSLFIEALDDDARAATVAALPDYRLVAQLDSRNLYFESEKRIGGPSGVRFGQPIPS
jgi:FkbM family methyltransferase